MKLKDLLPPKIYSAQKKLFKNIVDGGKKEIKKRADDIYIIQKKVLADVQTELVSAAKREASEFYDTNFDAFCGIVKEKVPFIGGLIVVVLQKYKKDILEVIVG